MGYDNLKSDLLSKIEDFGKARSELEVKISELDSEKFKIQEMKNGVIQMAKERQIGFPWLAKAYEEFFELQDKNLVDFLKYKNMPAVQASVLVSDYSKLKRKAEREARVYRRLVDYYESVFPSLVDLREEVEDIGELTERSNKYTPKELEDDATYFLSVEEYRKLPDHEKNSLALERYWNRPHRKSELGRMYERYVGFLFESEGYDVDYHGIVEGKKDLGRDLICTKNNDHVVIQCKYWSQFKTIYEKHIFQLFGTFFQYRDEHKDKKIKAVFYTSTKVSDLAKRFAKELDIKLMENAKMDKKYPCIKCNISKLTGVKIYHLPFDQQYDNTKIEIKKGEFYCSTPIEAEKAGFRRAFRWRGNN